LTVLEFVHPPKAGPALHLHFREDEVWYALEGEACGLGAFPIPALPAED